ncbi:MAG: hypothetical protein IJV64_06420 [Oscillospiraceae bacterium]|nr:hypothetical protein [Oscillospiraceae bacterium]
MKDFSIESAAAEYRETIKITETTDTNHADNINYAPKQIFENTVANRRDLENLQDVVAGIGSAIIKDITLEREGWQEIESEDKYKYQIDVAVEECTEDMQPNLSLAKASGAASVKAGLCKTCEGLDGYVRFWAMQLPDEDIEGTLALLSPSSGGGGGGGSYTLPVATETQLGGIKIGAGISSQADGTASVDLDKVAQDVTGDVTQNVVNDASASDESVDDMIDDVFGEESTQSGNSSSGGSGAVDDVIDGDGPVDDEL